MPDKIITLDNSIHIQNLIYMIRGKQVMLDSDLAMLYQVETGNLNKAMKRNKNRFPDDFCFHLSDEEAERLRFQIGISNNTVRGGRRYNPIVYSEQGISMLSAVLRSEVAIQVSIRIMKTFVEMRKYLANTTLILEKVNFLEIHQIESDISLKNYMEKTDSRLEQVFDYISSHEENGQKVFFDGQIFDAFSLLTGLIQKAERSITLIDGYVDISTLNILAKKKNNVNVEIFTLPGTKLSQKDISNFNSQYPLLTVKYTTAFHDRFLFVDHSQAYHIGASIKDAGRKCFGINRIEDSQLVADIITRASGSGK